MKAKHVWWIYFVTVVLFVVALGYVYDSQVKKYNDLIIENMSAGNKIEMLQKQNDGLLKELNSYQSIKNVVLDDDIKITLFLSGDTGIAVCDLNNNNLERECLIIAGCISYLSDQGAMNAFVFSMDGSIIANAPEGNIQMQSKYTQFDLSDSSLYQKYSSDLVKIMQ